MGTNWLAMWEDYVQRTGNLPSQSGDDISRKIYSGVKSGAMEGRPGYKEFYDKNRALALKQDWISLWREYEQRTGKRPSGRSKDPYSRRIYLNVQYNKRAGKPGYKELFDENRKEPLDWIVLWKEFEKTTGRKPSASDQMSVHIYRGVLRGVRYNKPGYREFFKENSKSSTYNWLQLWSEYVLKTGKRPSAISKNELSRKIYDGVAYGARANRPGYREFFEKNRARKQN